MIDPDAQRLSSAHLEDLAYIILSARSDDDRFDLYPHLEDELRGRLRSRIKQLSRYDWPSSLREDPAFRRGYTLRQCCRLAIALLLLDAHLPPSLVVLIAQNNERGFLFAIAERLANPTRHSASASDQLAVILPAEIKDALAFPGWADHQPTRVRFILRSDLATAWTGDLAGPGARLIVDVGTAATALWRWISGRRLMDDTARLALVAGVDSMKGQAAFEPVAARRLRR